MKEVSNFYDILGVKHSASSEQIRQAYVREALKYHPDRNPDPDSTTKFQLVGTAFHVLSDAERRSAYNSSLEMDDKFQVAQLDPYSLFGSVFEDLFIPEVPNPVYFWQPLGLIAGIIIGFILFNIPGAILLGYYGSRAGKVRDFKGVSVYEAYKHLSRERRTEILKNLAKKLFTTAIQT